MADFSSRYAPVSWAIRKIPNLLALAALGGIAWWGHTTGWSVPKFSTLIGHPAEPPDDWCGEHAVTESQCIECNKSLVPRPKSFGWCPKHGVSECVIDHPELSQTLSAPKLPKYDTQLALSLLERGFNNSKCNLHERRIQFASEEAFVKSGVDVDMVSERPMMEYKTASGEIVHDPNFVAKHSSRFSGNAWWIPKKLGDVVRRGEILAIIDSAEVGKAKADYLLALSSLDQKVKLLENVESFLRQGIYKPGSVQEIEAKSAHREAESRLLATQQQLINLGFPIPEGIEKKTPAEQSRIVQFLGLPRDLSEQVSHLTMSANLLPIRATLDGIITHRDIVAGENVDLGKVLFIVADASRMWVNLAVRQEDMRFIKLGQKVLFRSSANPVEIESHVSWISTEVDEKTRTVMVRSEIANADGTHRSNTFGTARIVIREEKHAIAVPNDAIQWEGDCHIVFVRDKNYFKKESPKFFHVRKVRIGARDQTHTELLAGVLPDEVVASKGSSVLRGELLKGNLGEG